MFNSYRTQQFRDATLSGVQGLGQKFSDATSVESDPGDGVIATCKFRVAATTNGAWTRLGYGDGITPTQLDGFVSETYGSDAVTVSGISRTFPNGGTMPSLVPITDDYARYVYDIVHVPGLARFQSLFVTTFTAEDVGRMTRVSWHNQRPGERLDVLLVDVDGVGWGDPTSQTWQGHAEVMTAPPPSPPPPLSPPPRVEQIQTIVYAGPEDGSTHPLGTVFTFKLRAEPSCAECGLPVVTEMHVRTAKEVAGAADHAQPWGSWRQASPTREGYVYTHYPKENGIYRFEAKAVDGGLGATLEDTTPVYRRYIVGARITAKGALDRARGVIDIAFSSPVPTDRVKPEDVFDETSLAKLGPGALKIDWFNSTRLRVILPPAEKSNVCAAWRDARTAAVAASAAPPTDLRVTLKDANTYFAADSGFEVDGDVDVAMGPSAGATPVNVAGPPTVGQCAHLKLTAAPVGGGWDGVTTWRLLMTNTSGFSPEPKPDVDVGAVDAILDAANAATERVVTFPPSSTVSDTKYTFLTELTNCQGEVSNETIRVDRVAGVVPYVYPAAGALDFVTYYSNPFEAAFDVALPERGTPGGACDVDASNLVYVWRNISAGRADCMYTDEKDVSNRYAGSNYKLAPRATRRTLATTPFCLGMGRHVIQLTSYFEGSVKGTSESITFINVEVVKSPVVALIAGGAGPRAVQKGSVFDLDGSGSTDPDLGKPGAPGNNQTFTWYCKTLSLDAETGVETESSCEDELDELFQSNGKFIRGVGEKIRVGPRYKFTLTYQNAGLTNSFSTIVTAVVDPVPVVVVKTPHPAIVSSTAPLRLVGSVSRARGSGDGKIRVSWSSSPPLDFSDRRLFATPTNSPRMTINANVLVPGERYVFTLRARQDGQAADGFASTGAIFVAGPPDPGTVIATPSEGTALDTMFTIATEGWGGGSLRYTLGYVLSDARGRDVNVPLLVESTLSQVSGLLPANVSSDHARIFAIARATDAHGASSRVEGTVRVLKTPRGDETKAAKRALETALRVGDPGMRAAAAVTAAAALNTLNTDRSSMPAADVKERREVRAGAMDAVSAAATRAIEDAVDGVEIDPGVLSTYVTSVAAVAAVPAELTKQTAELGLTTVTGLLRARSSMPAPIEVTSAAAAMVSGAVEVQLDSLVAKPPESNATLNATTTTGGAVAVASTQLYGTRRRRLLRYRRLLQDDNSTKPVELIDGAPVIDPLVAKALDGSVAVAFSVTRGQAPNETGAELLERHVTISAKRYHVDDLAAEYRSLRAPHVSAARYSLPKSVADGSVGQIHADVFLYRWSGAALPSATRIMTDASAIDVVYGDGSRPSIGADEEVVASIPFTGVGLETLEKVIYEYKCARHSGGVWRVDEADVRTVSVTEADGGSVTCAGRGNAFIGYALGAVIAPINFTLVADETSKGSTAQGYWFFMAALSLFTILLSVCCLRSGMRRYQVKIANKDDYEIEN